MFRVDSFTRVAMAAFETAMNGRAYFPRGCAAIGARQTGQPFCDPETRCGAYRAARIQLGREVNGSQTDDVPAGGMSMGAEVVLQKHLAAFRLPARPVEGRFKHRPGGDIFFDAEIVLALRTHHQVMFGKAGLARKLRSGPPQSSVSRWESALPAAPCLSPRCRAHHR